MFLLIVSTHMGTVRFAGFFPDWDSAYLAWPGNCGDLMIEIIELATVA